jgi:hypothetical protein
LCDATKLRGRGRQGGPKIEARSPGVGRLPPREHLAIKWFLWWRWSVFVVVVGVFGFRCRSQRRSVGTGRSRTRISWARRYGTGSGGTLPRLPGSVSPTAVVVAAASTAPARGLWPHGGVGTSTAVAVATIIGGRTQTTNRKGLRLSRWWRGASFDGRGPRRCWHNTVEVEIAIAIAPHGLPMLEKGLGATDFPSCERNGDCRPQMQPRCCCHHLLRCLLSQLIITVRIICVSQPVHN